MSEISIEKASPDEWEFVKALRIRAVTEHPKAFGSAQECEVGKSEQEWRVRLEKGNYLFAKVGKELVGMVCFVQEEGAKLCHVAFIYSMYVCPEVRRQGVGRKLIEGLIDDMRQRFPEIVKVKLAFLQLRMKHVSYNKSLGFREIGIMEKELRVGNEFIDEYQMEKFIRLV